MRARPSPAAIDRICTEIACEQHGVLSLDQARAAGHSRDGVHVRVVTGRWQVVLPRVFRVAGAPPSWEQDLMAACLHAGPGAAASHRSAAALWELAGVDNRAVEIATPRRVRRPGMIVHQTKIAKRSIARVGPIPVTDVTRTLFDLGAVAPSWVVESALDDALRRELTTLRRLHRLLRTDGGRGHRGCGILRALLDARDPHAAPAESVLETRLARLIRGADLPPPIPQFRVRAGRRIVARIDFAWPDAMVAVEADGFRHHSDRAAWTRDNARRNILTALGWHVVHVSWDDVNARREATVATIRAALRAALHRSSDTVSGVGRRHVERTD